MPPWEKSTLIAAGIQWQAEFGGYYGRGPAQGRPANVHAGTPAARGQPAHATVG